MPFYIISVYIIRYLRRLRQLAYTEWKLTKGLAILNKNNWNIKIAIVNDASICNCVDDMFFYKMWIDKDVNDWNVYEINSFSELFIFIKIEMNNLANWISSFTFILFINKNDLKDENELWINEKWNDEKLSHN